MIEDDKTIGFINIYIDEITPCLKDTTTGELVDTEVIRIKRKSFLQKYNKKNGWYIDWASLSDDSEIYALVIAGTVDIQGLIAIQNNKNAGATYMQWACAAPHNNKQLTDNVRYTGVGGHLFAIAGKKSLDNGFNGDVYGFAANEKLLSHYTEKLGAEAICILHQFHFGIFGEEMKKLMEIYTYEWTDEEL